MDRQAMVKMIDAEIERLQEARKLLEPELYTRMVLNAKPKRTVRRKTRRAPVQRRKAVKRTARPAKKVSRPMSAADREKRSQAQKQRWARLKAIPEAKPTTDTGSDAVAS